MKRIFLALLLCFALLFTACAPAATETAEQLKVVATIFPPYDFAREIGGDFISLTMLLPPGTESHTYEPTPKDMQAIAECDVFLWIGGESEAWADKILSSIDTSSIRVVRLMDSIEHKLLEDHEGHDHEEEDEHESEEVIYDEHIWTSPRNAMLMNTAIVEAFAAVDPAHAQAYRDNSNGLMGKMSELDTTFTEISKSAKMHTLIFGDRFPFRYFTEEYGFDYFSAYPGCSVDSEPSAATVASLSRKVKNEQIPVVFYLELSNEKMADILIEGTSAEKRLFHSCHNVSREEFLEGATYYSLMQGNVERLKEAVGL